jgi:hypothetical protein
MPPTKVREEGRGRKVTDEGIVMKRGNELMKRWHAGLAFTIYKAQMREGTLKVHQR